MKMRSQIFCVCCTVMCLALSGIVSVASAEDFAALPGIALSGVGFDTSEEAFASLYPSARKGAAGSSYHEYWVSQGSVLYLVGFRSGKLGVFTASLGKLADDEQRRQTGAIVEAMINRFGAPKRFKTAKLLRGGVAEMNALVFDVKGFRLNAVAIVESSELELAVTVLNTELRSLDKMFFSAKELLTEVNKGTEQPKKALEPDAFVDYIRDLPLRVESKLPGSPTPPTVTPSSISPIPNGSPAAFSQQAAPALQTPAASSDRQGVVWRWAIGIVALIVIVVLVWRRRS